MPEYDLLGFDDSVTVESLYHVDYLTHEWAEDDLWRSWSHIIAQKDLRDGKRLENASWRAWAKVKSNLSTVHPESLNWHKQDCTTWLYGPLRSQPVAISAKPRSETPSTVIPNRSITRTARHRSILKNKRISRSLSRQVLPSSRWAKEAMMRTEGRVHALPSDTSTISIPQEYLTRRVTFNEQVEQCISVDKEQASEDDISAHGFKAVPVTEAIKSCFDFDSDSDSDSDEGLMMKPLRMRRGLSLPGRQPIRKPPVVALLPDEKTIAALLPARLKWDDGLARRMLPIASNVQQFTTSRSCPQLHRQQPGLAAMVDEVASTPNRRVSFSVGKRRNEVDDDSERQSTGLVTILGDVYSKAWNSGWLKGGA